MTSRFVIPLRSTTAPARRRPPRAARLAAAAAVALAIPTAPPPSPSGVATRYQNTWAKDFIMDAPWRVVDAATPIPLLVVLKDCEADEIAALRWLRCRDLTGGAAVTLWLHDGADERIGDDPAERDCRAWLTTVTAGHPALPDGTPLTPANLGYRAGDVITLEVSICFRDNLLWDETATRILRVRVGYGPFPWPSGWHGGDLHTHSMFTNNIAEWGAPLPALRAAATAIGLRWAAVTDHSCDLDQTVDGPWSYVTREWQYTVQTPAGEQTFTRDVFAADGTTWGGLTAEIAAADGPDLRLLRGVEINLASVDPATPGRTLHALFLGAGYIASPLSGAPGERPVFPTVPVGLDALATSGGFAFAAHPWDDLASEWADVDLGVNGAVWGAGDFAAALPRDVFRGVELFNTRAVVRSNAESDPWADFDAGLPAANPYPAPLLAGLARFDALLRAGLTGWPPRRQLLAAGSDAHGDFNYATHLALDDWADDNALGKVQTVLRVPGPWGPGNAPPTSDLLAALRAGHSLVTDGPFLELALDTDRDNSPDGPTDLHPGDATRVNPATCPPLLLRWASLPEFGPVAQVRLLALTPTATRELDTRDPRLTGQPYAGFATVPLTGRGLTGPVALRAELTTADNAAGHRAFTNPLWLDFNPVIAIDPDDPADPADPANAPHPDAVLILAPAAPNPAVATTTLRFTLGRPASVTLTIHDLAGRRIRRLLDGCPLSAGPHTATWDGRDNAGAPVAAGVYAVRLTAGGHRRGGLVQISR
jgi:hypothetical protein